MAKLPLLTPLLPLFALAFLAILADTVHALHSKRPLVVTLDATLTLPIYISGAAASERLTSNPQRLASQGQRLAHGHAEQSRESQTQVKLELRVVLNSDDLLDAVVVDDDDDDEDDIGNAPTDIQAEEASPSPTILPAEAQLVLPKSVLDVHDFASATNLGQATEVAVSSSKPDPPGKEDVCYCNSLGSHPSLLPVCSVGEAEDLITIHDSSPDSVDRKGEEEVAQIVRHGAEDSVDTEAPFATLDHDDGNPGTSRNLGRLKTTPSLDRSYDTCSSSPSPAESVAPYSINPAALFTSGAPYPGTGPSITLNVVLENGTDAKSDISHTDEKGKHGKQESEFKVSLDWGLDGWLLGAMLTGCALIWIQ